MKFLVLAACALSVAAAQHVLPLATTGIVGGLPYTGGLVHHSPVGYGSLGYAHQGIVPTTGLHTGGVVVPAAIHGGSSLYHTGGLTKTLLPGSGYTGHITHEVKHGGIIGRVRREAFPGIYGIPTTYGSGIVPAVYSGGVVGGHVPLFTGGHIGLTQTPGSTSPLISAPATYVV